MKTEMISPLVPALISLPEELGNTTLNQLLQHNDTEIIKKGNKLSFRRNTDFGIATLEIETYETGRKNISQSTVPKRCPKSAYIYDIIKMKQNGMKQKDIAFQLGISESYVTKLIQEFNKNES